MLFIVFSLFSGGKVSLYVVFSLLRLFSLLFCSCVLHFQATVLFPLLFSFQSFSCLLFPSSSLDNCFCCFVLSFHFSFFSQSFVLIVFSTGCLLLSSASTCWSVLKKKIIIICPSFLFTGLLQFVFCLLSLLVWLPSLLASLHQDATVSLWPLRYFSHYSLPSYITVYEGIKESGKV